MLFSRLSWLCTAVFEVLYLYSYSTLVLVCTPYQSKKSAALGKEQPIRFDNKMIKQPHYDTGVSVEQ
ncbi:hypothetical protein PALB_26220 [Pseudoalteromonas luteoviolacea B = ATCC 29581]|nr:hypothetical protein PALB_26220 [Pseudoalteromonas luteoviolacea B = ATCC 29581]